MLDELTRQRDELSRVRDQVAQLTARAVSADRLVAVTVNARGMLVDLQLEPLALRRHRADQLSALITSLVADADGSLQEKRNELFAALVQPSPDYADVRGDGESEL